MQAVGGHVGRLMGRPKLLAIAAAFFIVIISFLARALARRFLEARSRKHIKSDKPSHTASDRNSLPSSSSRRHKRGSSSSSSKNRRDNSSKKLDSSLPTMILLLGVHGSGKSTWAMQYVEKVRKSAVIVSSDVLRRELTGSIDDYSRETLVRESLLAQVHHQTSRRRSIIIDDCQHNLDPVFRSKLMELAPEGEYNRVARRFPIKSMFARSRIDKDLAEGKVRHNPSAAELDSQMAMFDALEEAIKTEGWYEEK